MVGVEGDISRIPLWLTGSAVVFAVLVGMLAGFFPAVRAMKPVSYTHLIFGLRP